MRRWTGEKRNTVMSRRKGAVDEEACGGKEHC
jgi:hypothetical protein